MDLRAFLGRGQRSPEGPASGAGRRRTLLVATCIVAAVYLGAFTYRGWVPHDEGLLAQTAERVLSGELPHRDFDDTYTGGLTFLHALAFQLLGVKLTSIRIALFVFALAFVPALYAIAARVAVPWVAGLAVLAFLAWSLPNYFAGVPSWYILFFTIFGVLFLLRYLDTGRRRWLIAAGLCGGLSLIFKIVGLYFVAAALLFLLFHEQMLAAAKPRQRAGRASGSLILTGLIGVTIAGLLLLLVRRHFQPMVLFNCVVPGVAVCGVLVWNEWRVGGAPVGARLLGLTAKVAPFALGVVLPVLLFLVPFARGGGLDELVRGVFVLPQLRLEHSVYPFPGPIGLVAALPVAVVLVSGFRSRRRLELLVLAVLAPALAGLLALAGKPVVYRAIWYSLRCILPMVVLLACWQLVRAGRNAGASPPRRQELFLVAAMTAFVSLTQYPYAFGIYFCYVAPLLGLAVLYVTASQPAAPRRLQLCLLLFYLGYALIWLNTGSVRATGVKYLEAAGGRLRLDLPRGGIRVPERDQQIYEALVALIQRHSAEGSYIYAAPDCPEVYFLSARKNPTRTMYDFFAATGSEAVQKLLDEKEIQVVVINRAPPFSPRIAPDVGAALKARFTRTAEVGHFAVGWREPARGGGAPLAP